MRRRLLVVARDVNLRATLARWLAPAGFAIELAEGARRAREVLDAGEIAAGILRIERSDAAILPIARELRDAGGRLIVVLDEAPAKGQSMRYRLDADAFLREPLTEQAVVERINAVLAPIETREKAPGRPETLKINGMTLDLSGHSLVDAAGRQVRLTRGEFALLATFARHPGRVLSRDRLLDAVSGRRAGTFDRSIDNMVARLRRKIERNAKKPCLVITVPGVGYQFVARSPVSDAPSQPGAAGVSLLVLPFASLGGGALLSHVADGISTMLTAELEHIIGATVLGEGAPRSAGADAARAIGRRRGARYVLRGWVRRSGDEVRVNSCLTEVRSGAQVWAECIDGRVAALFAFETEVTARIARAIELELVAVESRSGRDRRGGPSLMDLVASGRGYLNRPRSAQNLGRARALFESALRLDDRCSEAIAGLAQTHISDALNGWSKDPAEQVHRAETLAARAIEMKPRFAYAYYLKGLALRVQARHGQALAALERAIQLTPSLAPAYVELGFTRQISGGAPARSRMPMTALRAPGASVRRTPSWPIGSAASASLMFKPARTLRASGC